MNSFIACIVRERWPLKHLLVLLKGNNTNLKNCLPTDPTWKKKTWKIKSVPGTLSLDYLHLYPKAHAFLLNYVFCCLPVAFKWSTRKGKLPDNISTEPKSQQCVLLAATGETFAENYSVSRRLQFHKLLSINTRTHDHQSPRDASLKRDVPGRFSNTNKQLEQFHCLVPEAIRT